MRKNIIFLSRDDVIYRGISYEINYFLKNIINRKKRRIVIVGEGLYIYVHEIKSNEELKSKNINLLIEKKLGGSKDYLVNYEISRDRKKIYIYALRGGAYIDRLCEAPIKVNIEPIQINFVKLCNKIIKAKNYIYIFEYRNIYYYISVKNGYLEDTLIKDNLQEDWGLLENNNKKIYVDSLIKEKINGDRINIKERSIYNEKLY